MNRVSVILLCITTLAIYFIIAKKPELDIKKYEDQIKALEQEIVEKESENDSLQKQSLELEKAIAAYDVIIENFRNQIYDIQRDAQEKVDAVDNFGDDELEQFFAERYKRLVKSKNDSIN
jgi:septal ring factor EnvC (AmiA/AmiB activator)